MLVIEGIHGLNEKLTPSVPAEHKNKKFMSVRSHRCPLTSINRIRTTDMRLLRRMVRDSQFRSHDAETTLRTWSDVRDGEEKYIFPYQSSADIIFNTTLIYELAVLKKYAEPLLRAVPQSAGMAYTTAHRLLNILSYVKPLEDNVIPNNSILREFIGGSVFKDAL